MLETCVDLVCKETIQFVNNETGRKITLKAGTVCTVTSCSSYYKDTGFVKIARKKGSHVNVGWVFDIETVNTFFEVSK